MRESQADDTEVYSRCTDFSQLPLLLEINFFSWDGTASTWYWQDRYWVGRIS